MNFLEGIDFEKNPELNNALVLYEIARQLKRIADSLEHQLQTRG